MTPQIRLGKFLLDEGYRFTTVTPATQARVNARMGHATASSLRDVFGWSRPFRRGLFPEAYLAIFKDAGVLLEDGEGLLRSTVRFSTIGDAIFMHSAWPTTGSDAVFFGPDTCRFVELIRRSLGVAGNRRNMRIADLRCGSGAGGIMASRMLGGDPGELLFTDINSQALAFARVNAALAGISGASFLQGDLYAPVREPVDLILANPPYLLDPQERLYRHGGGEFGGGLSLRIVVEGVPMLRPGGMMVLYTGSPVVHGSDSFLCAVRPHLEAAAIVWDYAEIDPDVFGEELELPAYARVDRIAAVGLVIRRPAS